MEIEAEKGECCVCECVCRCKRERERLGKCVSKREREQREREGTRESVWGNEGPGESERERERRRERERDRERRRERERKRTQLDITQSLRSIFNDQAKLKIIKNCSASSLKLGHKNESTFGSFFSPKRGPKCRPKKSVRRLLSS